MRRSSKIVLRWSRGSFFRLLYHAGYPLVLSDLLLIFVQIFIVPWVVISISGNQVIKDIQTLPGFENFLKRRSFNMEELYRETREGPIVILTKFDHAIILSQAGCYLDKVPFSSDAVTQLHKEFRSMAKSRCCLASS